MLPCYLPGEVIDLRSHAIQRPYWRSWRAVLTLPQVLRLRISKQAGAAWFARWWRVVRAGLMIMLYAYLLPSLEIDYDRRTMGFGRRT